MSQQIHRHGSWLRRCCQPKGEECQAGNFLEVDPHPGTSILLEAFPFCQVTPLSLQSLGGSLQ